MLLLTNDKQADILVSGAGAAGLSAAIALGQRIFGVCVGNSIPAPRRRTVALFEASLRFYKALGVWPHFRGKDRAACRIADDRRYRGAFPLTTPFPSPQRKIGLAASARISRIMC